MDKTLCFLSGAAFSFTWTTNTDHIPLIVASFFAGVLAVAAAVIVSKSQ